MRTESIAVKKALNDIHLLRQLLNQADQSQADYHVTGCTLSAHLLLQWMAFVFALGLLLTEIFSHHAISFNLLAVGDNSQLVNGGIGLMAMILVGLSIVLYFIVWRSAIHHGENMETYIARHFKYMRQLSFISDLLMKFMAIALLMLAGKQLWIAPLLLAFTGDYLLQGRFFTLTTKTSILLGVACIGLAFYQFFSQSGLLLMPLAAFTVVAGFSCARLVWRYRQQSMAAV